MTARAWDDIKTGVESMDTEHGLQLSLVNALDELIRNRMEPSLIAKTIGQLVEFTTVHFLSEELMMRVYRYPGLDAHKLEHGRLAEQVEQTRRSLEAGDDAAALATIDVLHSWLAGHIRSMDDEFARWCEKSGIRAR
jgi:hemerythrin-like metal-binding protein